MAALMQVQPSLAARRNKDKEDLAETKKSVAGEGEADGEGDRRQQESGRDEGCCEREGDKARVVEGVLAALPTFSKRYGLGRAGMYASYVNDELGSAFRHSERPNCQMSLFMFSSPSASGGGGGGVVAYSVLWPLRRLRASEEATLDLLRSTAWAGATSVAARGAFVRGLSLPCSLDRNELPAGTPHTDHESLSLPRDRLAKRQRRMDSSANEYRARLAATATAAAVAAGIVTPAAPVAKQASPPSPLPSSGVGAVALSSAGGGRGEGRGGLPPLSVWTDLPYLSDGETGLTRPEFRVLDCGLAAAAAAAAAVVASPRDADVVWSSSSIDPKFEAEMGGLRPGQLVNQFPYEAALVVKSHLARTIQREFGSRSPKGDVMQPTFDMQSEDDALAFMADFRRRRDAGADNIWIVKPIGLARSMDTTVTGSLADVLRASDTGPKVAQLYLSRPLLWKRRKFDLRIVALLVSAHPLELYVHDCYWPRVAERPHETEPPERNDVEQQQQGEEVPLSQLEDPRVSLTAMHLLQGREGGQGGRVCHPDHEEFAREMHDTVSQRHAGATWDDVMAKTRAMILSVFRAAARQQPGMRNGSARAMYGCDVMVTAGLEPRLLEVTFSPGNLAASPAWTV
ncbi:unnamed protein product, partial [Ectocarpus fasciculatus]